MATPQPDTYREFRPQGDPDSAPNEELSEEMSMELDDLFRLQQAEAGESAEVRKAVEAPVAPQRAPGEAVQRLAAEPVAEAAPKAAPKAAPGVQVKTEPAPKKAAQAKTERPPEQAAQSAEEKRPRKVVATITLPAPPDSWLPWVRVAALFAVGLVIYLTISQLVIAGTLLGLAYLAFDSWRHVHNENK